MDSFRLVLALVGGIALFLYGIGVMSSGLEKLAGSRMQSLLGHCTTNMFASVATGVAATILLDSSSVVIILLVGTANAGLVSFERAMGVVMGANIGTTISTQIFALQIDELAPVGLAIGFLLQSLGRTRRQQVLGTLVLGLGLIFFGLNQMSGTTAPLRGDPKIINYIQRLENPVTGAIAGAIATAIIQSSSAMMGIVVALARSGTMTLPASMALMFGAEIGTCADTLLATIGRSRDAVLIGMFHLVFNVVSVVLGLCFAPQFVAFVHMISGSAPITQQIANGHILFNVLGVVLFMGVSRPVSRILRRLTEEERGPRRR